MKGGWLKWGLLCLCVLIIGTVSLSAVRQVSLSGSYHHPVRLIKSATSFFLGSRDDVNPDTNQLLFLMLGGGKFHHLRQAIIRKTWLDPDIDWGRNFTVFVFTNFEDRATTRWNPARSEGLAGEVLHQCGLAFKGENKCCLRARQLRFAAEYVQRVQSIEWVIFIDDDHYPVIPKMAEMLDTYKTDEPLAVGLTGCASANCTGFCGGGGIYMNRALVDLVGFYIPSGIGKGTLENWFKDRCDLCGNWADLTTMELLHEINRQEYEKHLWLGTNSRMKSDPLGIVNYNKIPDALSSLSVTRVSKGLAYLPTRDDKKFDNYLNHDIPSIWHYDYRSRTHEIHQAMIQHAVSYQGSPPPKTIPHFKSMREETEVEKAKLKLAEKKAKAKVPKPKEEAKKKMK